MTRKDNIAILADHPTNVQARVQRLATDPEKVRFSQNINDLARARRVSMAGIWACLENGAIDAEQVNRNELGLYGKFIYCATGQNIEVDFMIDSDGVLNVLYATTDEED